MSVQTAQRLVRHLQGDQGRRLLREFIERQRWYGGRGRTIADVAVVECVPVREGAEAPAAGGAMRGGDALDDGGAAPLRGDGELWIVLAEVRFEDGAAELYHLPLGRRVLAAADVQPDSQAVVEVAEEAGVPTVLFDAMIDSASVETLFEAISAQETHRGLAGEVRFRTLAAAGPDAPRIAPAGAGVTVRPLGKEQSNSAAVRADRELLKCLRRVSRGVSPELEMTGALAAAGFRSIATPLGAVDYVADDGGGDDVTLLATVQTYLHNGSEGFAMALTSLRDLFGHAEEAPERPRDDEARRRAVQTQGGTFLPEAVRIGEVVGRMHAALVSRDLPPALRPRAVDRAQLVAWADEFEAELDRLLAMPLAEVAPLRERRAPIDAAYNALRALPDGGLSIRVHGDLHLGQLLRVDSGWVVLDFEGEPARPLVERRRHSSPLNDVAGVLRSFDYAAAVAAADRAAPGHPEHADLLALGDTWARASRQATWDSYVATVAGTGLLPGFADADVMRQAFVLRKAVYEVGYELGHRPDWLRIPLRFLLSYGGETAL